jgi:hypothetical protein
MSFWDFRGASRANRGMEVMEKTPHPLCPHPPRSMCKNGERSPSILSQPLRSICIDGEPSPSVLSLNPRSIYIDRKHSPQKECIFLFLSSLIQKEIRNFDV